MYHRRRPIAAKTLLHIGVRAEDWHREAEREEVAGGWLGWASIWLSPSVVLAALALLFTGHPVYAALCFVLGFMPIPYASEAPIRRRPLALLLIVAVEFLVFPVITAQFLHGDAWHLAFNMALLLVLGPKVNDVLGNWGFAAAYLGLGAAAGLSHVYSCSDGPVMAGLGASGSAMVITGMYAILSPQHRIRMVAWFRVFLLTPLFCLPFRVRGIWLILFMVAMDLIPILTNAESNVGHGVHFIGFISGASVAAFLVALKKVNCGGYDLLSWCFGQEEIARDAVVSRRATDTWTRVLNHPVFMAGVMLMCAVSFLLTVVQGIWTYDRTASDWDGPGFPPLSATTPVNTPSLPTQTPPVFPESNARQQAPNKPNIVLSNARMWRSDGPGARSFEFSVDFRIDGADITPGDTYNWVIKPTNGMGVSTMVLWIRETNQGSPRRIGSQGTLSGSVLHVDPNTAGTVETYVEAEGWNFSGGGAPGRVKEKVSNTITFQLVSDPTPRRDPFSGSGGPSGLPGGRGGLPGQPGGPAEMPGGFPGKAPGGQPGGSPGGFPRGGSGRLPGRG